MILTLEVTGPQASALGQARRRVFGPEGGTIGRLSDNDWVLPEPYVSGRHAIIRFADGAFHIEDTSTNGVFLNSAPERIVRGRAYAIQSGDRITIDPYEIVVRVDDDPKPIVPAAAEHDVFATFDSSVHESYLTADPIAGLGLKGDSGAPKRPSGPQLGGEAPEWAHYTPPAVEPSAAPELIPPNWQDSVNIASPVQNPRAPARAAGKPEPRSVRPVSPPAADDSLSILLQEAGVGDAALTPELAREIGQVFRIVVSGVMDVLKARQQTRDEFGLAVTTFKRADNNPLKFSNNVEEALQRLFVRRTNSTYLGPVAAFQDAFEDMRNHQIAMLVGVRVAFEAMLSEFEPDHLQEQFDRQVKKGALVSMPARLRYWELYRDWIHDMVRDADTSFRELFGDEFARAYEQQLKRLKTQGRSDNDPTEP